MAIHHRRRGGGTPPPPPTNVNGTAARLREADPGVFKQDKSSRGSVDTTACLRAEFHPTFGTNMQIFLQAEECVSRSGRDGIECRVF